MTEPSRTSPEPRRGGSCAAQLFRAFRAAEPPEPPLSLKVGERGEREAPGPAPISDYPGSRGFGGFALQKTQRLHADKPNPLHGLCGGSANAGRGFGPLYRQCPTRSAP